MARLIELKQTAPERFLARFDTGEEMHTTLAVVTDYHLSCGKELTEAELDTLRAADVALGRVWSEPPTLNDVFLEITGRELRD